MYSYAGKLNPYGFDLRAYLSVLGFPEFLILRPTLETLFLITHKHV
jgi:hypothetical protein